MKILCIDIGGTEIKYAVLDEDLNFYHQSYIPTPHGEYEEFLDCLKGIYDQFKDETEGIAVSLPGFIDTKTGYQKGGGAITCAIGKSFRDDLSKKCGCKVAIENDGKAAAVAEYWKGALEGCSNAAAFIIGTGVGGGIIIDGKLLKGKDYTAGEFSFVIHEPAKYSDKHLAGSLAMACSTTALLLHYKALTNSEEMIDGREFFKRYHQGDEKAAIALDTLCTNIAIQCTNLGVLLNAEKVAIGGGISRQPVLIEKIKEKMETTAVAEYMKYLGNNYMIPEIVPCHFTSDANLVGALYTYLNM